MKFIQMTNVVSDVTSNVVILSQVISVVQRTIERDLAAMQKMVVLISEGKTSAGHWVVIQKLS